MPAMPGSAGTRRSAPWGGFAGLRALWDRAVLLRLEVGYAGQGGPAFYIVTGEQF